MTNQEDFNPATTNQEHSLLKSIVLHLLPGVLGGAVYFGTAGWVRSQGFPSIAALVLAVALVLTPFQLAVLWVESRRKKIKLFGGVIQYVQPLSFREYLIWVPVIILASGLIMTAIGPVSNYSATLFSWIPAEMVLDMGLGVGYTKPVLVTTYIFILLFPVLIGPAVEELYFRGYLLPRMPSNLRRWIPLLHSLLFTVYHTWSPWMFIARVFGILPLVYVTQRKGSLYPALIAHCLLNSIDFFIGATFILNNF